MSNQALLQKPSPEMKIGDFLIRRAVFSRDEDDRQLCAFLGPNGTDPS